jgi:hypothetical protein
MKSTRLIGTATVGCGVALFLAGGALASDVSIDTTGPQSLQDIKLQNSNEFKSSNFNFTNVLNSNDQQASTGNVTADDNTTVGGLSSGNASNNNSTSTSIGIHNDGLGAGLPSNPGTGVGAAPQPGGSTGQGSGNVLGASTSGQGAGEAVLPTVGAEVPVDVSALRAAWHPQTGTPTAALVKSTQGVTGAMLAVAAVLSLLGGVGSAVFARRKERRV